MFSRMLLIVLFRLFFLIASQQGVTAKRSQKRTLKDTGCAHSLEAGDSELVGQVRFLYRTLEGRPTGVFESSIFQSRGPLSSQRSRLGRSVAPLPRTAILNGGRSV